MNLEQQGMRSKDQILAPWGDPDLYQPFVIIAEVLLDIRDLLQKPPVEITGKGHEPDCPLQNTPLQFASCCCGVGDVNKEAPPEKDQLFDEAVTLVRKQNRVSPKLLIDNLEIPYVKATKLIEQLEAYAVIAPREGTKPRKVL